MAKPDPLKLLKGLDDIAALGDGAATARPLPPVHLWNPPFCGDVPMVIKRDGSWHYLGSPISRKRMVQLFSSILRRDGDGLFYLVTPVEKCGIVVEDAPFVAVELSVEGTGREQILALRTQVDDWVTADADHPIRVVIDPTSEEPSPYIRVRDRLDALVNRAVFYQLVDLAVIEQVDGEASLGVWSRGVFFPFVAADRLSASGMPQS